MTDVRNATPDRQRFTLTCSSCGLPITTDDLFDLELRTPDDGESQDDYFSAELLDDLTHANCIRAKGAG